jgi:hypothetical protein
MKKACQPIDTIPNPSRSTLKEILLYQSEAKYQEEGWNNFLLEEFKFDHVMRDIQEFYTPSVLVGTVGVWTGRFAGYRYCSDFEDFRKFISTYDDIDIRQIGVKLHFTLKHHDGRHEMELRRLTEYGYDHLDVTSMEFFNEETLAFIKRHTNDFGEIPYSE